MKADIQAEPLWQRVVQGWNAFWFTPRDPTVLGLMRILCGVVTLYTMSVYSFSLQDFMGKHAWYDLQLRQSFYRDRANEVEPLVGNENAWLPTKPSTDKEDAYVKAYETKWGIKPPRPFPRDDAEAAFIDEYMENNPNNYDLRSFGLRPPRTQEERDYLKRYTFHKSNPMHRPPPAYATSEEEEKFVFDYMSRNGQDPRMFHSVGAPFWSIWFHVTDPGAMAVVHTLVILVTFLFTIGFCTRITTALTWMAAIWYIHRNTAILFGVDTMMVILLLYFMVGNSGGAYSVDRLIGRWWSRARPRVINRWRGLLGRTPLSESALAAAPYPRVPAATVSTNVAIRLLQVHVCVIYLIAGLSKLQGTAWWTGTAVWGTLANYEFAPMQFEMYNDFLHWLTAYRYRFEGFLTAAGLFTLAFEISYAFLIWRPATRWIILSGAIVLHGLIGLFMGLKTFSLLMLVMNMAFVRTEEAQKFLNLFRWFFTGPKPQPREHQVEPVTAIER